MNGNVKPLKIAYFVTYFGLGGAENISYETAKQLSKLGYEFHLFTQTYKFTYAPDLDKYIKVHMLDAGQPPLSEKNVNTMCEIIQREGIDLVCIIWMERETPVVLRERTGVSLMAWIHSSAFWELDHKRSNAEFHFEYGKLRKLNFKPLRSLVSGLFVRRIRPAVYQMYRNFIRDNDIVAVLCEGDKKEIVDTLKLSQEEQDKIVALINSMPDEVLSQEPPSDTGRRKEIIYVGRLAYHAKRVGRLLRIWKKAAPLLPDWELKIYGSGWAEHYFKAEAAEMALERMTFMGRSDQVHEVYKAAEVSCLVSQYEGWPLVLAEAQIAGVVPIAFDSSNGIREIMTPYQGDTPPGVLVPPFDEDVFVRELVRLCQDDAYRAELRKAALAKRAAYRFEQNIPTWEYIAQRVKENKQNN